MTAIHLQPGRDCPAGIRRRDAVDALSDATHWILATFGEWHRRIRGRAQLAGLDDRMLKDIGLTHIEREILVSKPFWRE